MMRMVRGQSSVVSCKAVGDSGWSGCYNHGPLTTDNGPTVMADRNVHYEAAFEAFLRERGIPCVAVDEAKRALFANAKLKSFDFVVYSKTGPNLLVDVKGRQVRSRGGRGRFETWTTEQD